MCACETATLFESFLFFSFIVYIFLLSPFLCCLVFLYFVTQLMLHSCIFYALTFKQCRFASWKQQKISEMFTCASQWLTCSLRIDFYSSDGLHSLFHPSHPRPSSSSPPASLYSHFPTSLTNDSCREACLINAPERQRNCGKTQRFFFQNMAEGNGDFRTISWSSFLRLFYCIRSLLWAVN